MNQGFEERILYSAELDALVRGFLKGMLTGLMRLTGAGNASLFLTDPETGELVLDQCYRAHGFAGQSAPAREGCSDISVPLCVRDNIFGVLNLSDKCAPGGFSEPDEALSVSVCRYADRIIEDLFAFWRMRHENASLHRETELLDRYSTVGRMAVGLAPKIKGPLETLRLRTDQLMVASSPDTGALRYLEEMKEGFSRIGRLTDRLLREAPFDPSPSPVGLNRLLDESVETLKLRVDKAIRISRSYDPDLPPLPDIGLEHVFVNIIKNALEAMPQGGELNISTAMDKNGIRISFTDTGTGIPFQCEDRIFEPFFTTKELKGSGLGLSISREIVRTCGGSIEVKSFPGKGSSFTVVIPLAKIIPQKI